MTTQHAQPPAELFILTSADAPAADIAAWANGAPVSVLYFSADYELLRQLTACWTDHAQFAPVGQLLNDMALRHKDAFVNLDEALRADGTDPLGWIASDIAERSPYASTFLLSACRLMVLQDALAVGGKYVAVVDDEGFGQSLSQAACQAGARTLWRGAPRSTGLKAGLRARLGGVARTLVRRAKLRRTRKQHSIKLQELRTADLLMVVWAKHDTFPAEGPIAEAPFLGALPSVLNEHGQKVAYLVLPLHWLDSYDAIIENALRVPDPVLIFEDTLSIYSIIAAGWRSLYQGRALCDRLHVAGHDLSAVVAYEKAREWRSWRPGGARLFAQVGRYLKRHAIEPKAVLHLYENHSWEKCLRAGLRTHLPGTRVLGCQQSPFSPLYLNFLPSQRDLARGEVPHALLVSGERFAEEIAASGYPPSQIYTVGSFRYRAFLDQRPRQASVLETTQILCATGPDVVDCIELVGKVLEASAPFPSVRVLVNFHPLTDDLFRNAVKVAAAARDNAAQLTFVETGIQELLDTVDGVCYSDTNAVFEAMSKGVAVVHVQRASALDYDKAPQGSVATARSVEELSAVLQRLVDGTPVSFTGEEARAAINHSLGTIDYDAMLRAVLNSPHLR